MTRRIPAALAALCLAGVLAAGEPKVLLPAGVRADWAWGPGPALPAAARFTAVKDTVWLLARPNVLTNNRGQSLVLLFQAQDFAADGAGRFWFCDGRAAGSLDPSPDRSAAALKQALLLPAAAWRLADGRGDGMLAWGTDPDDGQASLVRLKDRRVLLRWPKRLSAVAATPAGLVLATAAGLLRVGDDGAVAALPFLKAARSLAWVDGAGLAVSTAEGVWLLPERGPAKPFLSAAGTRLAAAGGALYVLLPEQGGVLRLRGLERLK